MTRQAARDRVMLVNGQTFEFLMVPASSSGYMVHAPGILPFSAETVAEAEEAIREALVVKRFLKYNS